MKGEIILCKALPNLNQINHFIADHSILVFTGELRSAKNILTEQVKNTKVMSKDHYLDKMKEICLAAFDIFNEELSEKSILEIGKLLYESWKLKTLLANTIVNKKIEVMVNELMTCGAYGAKVLGAGGGGFIFAIGSADFKRHAIKKFGKGKVLDICFTNNGSVLTTIS